MSQITTHILDIARGMPAVGVSITLSKLVSDGWHQIGIGKTDADGRISDLVSADQQPLAAGSYKIHFETTRYFESLAQVPFYPWADVVFNIEGDGQHYHIPLLLSPYGYSTYRGS